MFHPFHQNLETSHRFGAYNTADIVINHMFFFSVLSLFVILFMKYLYIYIFLDLWNFLETHLGIHATPFCKKEPVPFSPIWETKSLLNFLPSYILTFWYFIAFGTKTNQTKDYIITVQIKAIFFFPLKVAILFYKINSTNLTVYIFLLYNYILYIYILLVCMYNLFFIVIMYSKNII